MKTIAILPERGEGTFSAVAGDRVATGRTAGEALDALTSQLSAEEGAVPVILQQFRPDRFFTASQRERLSSLMTRWRAARDAGVALPPSEQAELEKLVDEELQATGDRAAVISHNFKTVTVIPISPEEMMEEARILQELIEGGKLRERPARYRGVPLIAGFSGLLLILTAFILIIRGSEVSAMFFFVVGMVLEAAGLLLTRRAAAPKYKEWPKAR
jgi:hypothetical protein